MEFVDGPDLSKYRPPELLTALDIAIQICQALDHFHRKGIIHRDLKPSNVFLTREENTEALPAKTLVKVGDFGLARMHGGDAIRLTSSGYLMGTPLYAPPEQFVDASTVDHRADLYALGVMLYEFLTGSYPPTYEKAAKKYVEDTERGEEWLRVAKLQQTPPAPSTLNLDWKIPPQLDELVLKLLKPDPAERYQSAYELLTELSAIKTALTQSPFDLPVSTPAKSKTAPKTTSGQTALPFEFEPRTLPKGRHLVAADLMLARSPERVRAIFQALGYDSTEGKIEVTTDIGFTEADTENIISAHWLADYNDLQIMLVELQDLSAGAVRRLAQNLYRRGGDYFFVAVKPEISGAGKIYRQLVMVLPQRVGGIGLSTTPQLKLHRLVIDTARPTRHTLDVLEAMALPRKDLSPAEIYKKLLDAFSIERVTNRFYNRYATIYRDMVKKVREQNKALLAFNDPLEVKGFVQRLFGRLMFLYFLQKKGWLNEDSNFLTTQFRLYDGRYGSSGPRGNYYQEFLLPLFFETLACKEADRNIDPNAGSVWTEREVPYLNGGLFELGQGQEYEREVFIDNLLFAPDVDGGILDFFNSYDFTVEEDTPLESEVALDPEMLGKVFENLLEEDERGKSGTFYTPRSIVHFINRRALAGYLSDRLQAKRINLSPSDLMPHFDAAYDDPNVLPLERRAADAIEKALSELRALDPAVGSGAFPVGLLQDMVAMRKAVARAKKVRVEAGSGQLADWKREYISHCLYGVDIKPAAIEIAKLRLWLSLVVDLDRDQLQPLPNLDYKLMVGNSLLEMGGVSVTATTPNGKTVQTTLGLSDYEQAQADFEQKREEWYDFDGNAEEKRTLREELRELERRLLLISIEEQEDGLKLRLKNLTKSHYAELRKKEGRFKKEAEAINLTQATLDDLKKQVQEGLRPFFDFRLYFSDVFQVKGGFDIVLGNPPYGATLSDEEIKYFQSNYKLQDYQLDTYMLFMERGLSLLKDAAVLAFIIPDTWLVNLQTVQLRKHFFNKTTIETIVHYQKFVFESAIVDSEVILVRKSIPDQIHNIYITTVEKEGISESYYLPQKRWQIANGKPVNIFEKEEITHLTDKLRGFSTLESFCIVTQGAKPFQVGKGKPHQTQEIVDSKPYVSKTKVNATFRPLLRGSLIQKYKIRWNNDYWISFGPWLAEPRYSAKYDAPEKIVVRQTGDSIVATLDKYQFIVRDNLYTIVPRNLEVNLSYILGLLNSKLLNWYYQNVLNSEKGQALAQVKRGHLIMLPIIGFYKSEISELRRKIEEIVQKLLEQGPDVLEAAGWQAEIDRIVYEIYGLNEEEIKLVEGDSNQAPSSNKGN
jgi:type I restriction-modification system DNA methylase subunit